MATLRPIFSYSQSHYTRGIGDIADEEYFSDGSEPLATLGKRSATNRKTVAKTTSSDQRAASTPLKPQHVDLTMSDDDPESDHSEQDPEENFGDFVEDNLPTKETSSVASSESVSSVLGDTRLPEHLKTKYLRRARREFTNQRPPFVRFNKSEIPKTVTLTAENGEILQPEVRVTLAVQEWDSKTTFYTLDRNGERLIVKPFGGRFLSSNRAGTQYRTWSGQGSRYENVPVAFAFNDDTQERLDSRKDVKDDLGSNLKDMSLQNSESLGDRGARVPVDAPRDGLGPVPHTRYTPPHPSPAESSTAAPKILEVAAGKRPASDTIANGPSLKKVCDTINVGLPPTLTSDKQERTFLFVPLPCSNSEMGLVKLRSAMTLPTLFSSVSAAAGLPEHEIMAIAVMLEREGSGQGKSIILRRNSVDAFEYFFMVIDVAACWKEEGGMMSVQLQLRRTYGNGTDRE